MGLDVFLNKFASCLLGIYYSVKKSQCLDLKHFNSFQHCIAEVTVKKQPFIGGHCSTRYILVLICSVNK